MKLSSEITVNDLDSLEFELEKEAVKQSKKVNYVNNKELLKEFIKYQPAKKKWVDGGKVGPPPPLSDKIGIAIMDIAHRRARSPRFVNYAPNWKQEMIADAIETCVKYTHNFNPEKSNNPFAYLTQLVTNALFQRIKKEHKQQYIKYKMFDDAKGFAANTDDNNPSSQDMELMNETNDMYQDRLSYINNFEEMSGMKKARKKKSKTNDSANLLDD